MDTATIIAVDGLVYASWLFIVSAGLTFIFGVLRILNIAHGSIYALGAYMGAYLGNAFLGGRYPGALSYVILLVSAPLVGVLVGPVLERIFLRHIYDKDEVVGLLTTFALFLILEDGIKLVWGIDPYFIDTPFSLLGNIPIAGISYAVYPFVQTGIAIVIGTGLWLLINRTRFGRQVTSVIADREISVAMGINVARINTVAFTIGAFLAALGGAFAAPMISVEPGMGIEVIVPAFAVVAIGGLGSIGGAALGCILVGVLRAAAVHFFPELEMLVIYVLMFVVLVFRPQGFFGAVRLRRI